MSDRNLKGHIETVHWCPIHLSTFDTPKHDRCLWDEMTGPRPGRGQCERYLAEIVIGGVSSLSIDKLVRRARREGFYE